MALADALVPRQNPDGTWTCNSTFSTLGLDSASCSEALPPHLLIPSLNSLLSAASSLLFCPLLFAAACAAVIMRRGGGGLFFRH